MLTISMSTPPTPRGPATHGPTPLGPTPLPAGPRETTRLSGFLPFGTTSPALGLNCVLQTLPPRTTEHTHTRRTRRLWRHCRAHPHLRRRTAVRRLSRPWLRARFKRAWSSQTPLALTVMAPSRSAPVPLKVYQASFVVKVRVVPAQRSPQLRLSPARAFPAPLPVSVGSSGAGQNCSPANSSPLRRRLLL